MVLYVVSAAFIEQFSDESNLRILACHQSASGGGHTQGDRRHCRVWRAWSGSEVGLPACVQLRIVLVERGEMRSLAQIESSAKKETKQRPESGSVFFFWIAKGVTTLGGLGRSLPLCLPSRAQPLPPCRTSPS